MPIPYEEFTASTLPNAADYPRKVILRTDLNKLQFSNGLTWEDFDGQADLVFGNIITAAMSPYTLTKAKLGTRPKFDTSGGAIELVIPAGVFSGMDSDGQQVFAGTRDGAGDLTITASGCTVDGLTPGLSIPDKSTFALQNHPTEDDRCELVTNGAAGLSTADWVSLGPYIAAGTSKTTPVDADSLPLADSAASNATKKLTWANLKATLKAYFDAIYAPIGASASPTTTKGDLIVRGASADGRLAVGTNDQSIVADSSQPLGVRWATLTSSTVGKQTIPVQAGSMIPAITSGCSALYYYEHSNGAVTPTLYFDASAIEYAHFSIVMPKKWNAGTVTASFRWWSATGSTNSVVWGIAAYAASDGDGLSSGSSLWGTAQTVTDAGLASAGVLRVSAETSALTIGQTPAKEDTIFFRVYRDATNGSDTLAADAGLLSVDIHITTDAGTDA